MAVAIPYTVEEFDELILLPENSEKRFELIGGEIIEVPSNAYSSEIAGNVLFAIKLYLREQGMAGHVTSEGGGYMVSGERYAPDVAYLSKAKQPELAKTGYNPLAPELEVEVVSPTDDERQLSVKIGNYLAAGTLIWVIRPPEQQVEIYTPGQPVKILGVDGVLEGGAVLPGFKLVVKEIFP